MQVQGKLGKINFDGLPFSTVKYRGTLTNAWKIIRVESASVRGLAMSVDGRVWTFLVLNHTLMQMLSSVPDIVCITHNGSYKNMWQSILLHRLCNELPNFLGCDCRLDFCIQALGEYFHFYLMTVCAWTKILHFKY